MKIVVDAWGGDYSPEQIIMGASHALKKGNGFSVVFVGKPDIISRLADEFEIPKGLYEVLSAHDVITNDDTPVFAVRKKTDSTIVRGLDYLKSQEDAKAFVSAGSTGAVLTGSVLRLGRLKGVERPALAPFLPTVTGGGQTLLLDCGANVDCKPSMLLQFGALGAAYVKAVHATVKPKVALLNNGTEEGKGNELSREAYKLLADSNLNFIGNLEARDILSGVADVVVADGFNGNIALKSIEGAAFTVLKLVKEAIIKGGLKTKLAGAILKPSFSELRQRLDFTKHGGAVFLGVKKIVIKAHGGAMADSICAAILQAAELAAKDICSDIAKEI